MRIDIYRKQYHLFNYEKVIQRKRDLSASSFILSFDEVSFYFVYGTFNQFLNICHLSFSFSKNYPAIMPNKKNQEINCPEFDNKRESYVEWKGKVDDWIGVVGEKVDYKGVILR